MGRVQHLFLVPVLVPVLLTPPALGSSVVEVGTKRAGGSGGTAMAVTVAAGTETCGLYRVPQLGTALKSAVKDVFQLGLRWHRTVVIRTNVVIR